MATRPSGRIERNRGTVSGESGLPQVGERAVSISNLKLTGGANPLEVIGEEAQLDLDTVRIESATSAAIRVIDGI